MGEEFTLALAFATGLFGALHCWGMCGGLAGGFFIQRVRPRTIAPQLLYHSARIAMYSLLGIGGAWLGHVLAQTGITGKAQGLIMIAVGLLLIVLGFRMLRADRPAAPPPYAGLPVRPGTRRSGADTLIFGTLNGLIPCSLVFTVAVKAASTADPARAALLMLAFGLGTLPAMLAVTWFGAAIGARLSGRAVRIAGVFVAAMGLWTLYEGYVFFDIIRGLANW